MTKDSLSLVVRKDTTSAEIAWFLRQAGQKLSRPGAGLRARQGVGADGKSDSTIVLYVRDLSTPDTVGAQVGLLIDNIKAFFNANEEYRLAARTLLERAQFAGSHEMECQDGTLLCPSLAKVLEGNGGHLTIDKAHHAWQAAFNGEARMQSGAVLAAFRKNTAELKGLPDERHKNGQPPRHIVEKGMVELSCLDALLSAPLDKLGNSERRHVHALFTYLDLTGTDDNVLDLKDQIASLIHMSPCHKTYPSHLKPSFVNSAAEVEHIRSAIKFAQAWLKAWKACPKRDGSLEYRHIKALDYLAYSILRLYLPDNTSSADLEEFSVCITADKREVIHKSIRQGMDAKFVKWLDEGKPAYAFFQ